MPKPLPVPRHEMTDRARLQEILLASVGALVAVVSASVSVTLVILDHISLAGIISVIALLLELVVLVLISRIARTRSVYQSNRPILMWLWTRV